MDKIELLEECLKQLNLEINEVQKNQFEKYCSLLIEKNKVMNLTSITDEMEIITKHFVDSLMICKVMDLHSIDNLIDVGTGAGFPGVPIKIMYPQIKVTLLDSLEKRVRFLDEVISELELKDIEAYHGRAEDYGKDQKYREQYDLCVSRAVSNLSTLSEYCVPFVKVKGCFVSYKSSGADQEIKEANHAIGLLGSHIKSVHKEKLPGSDIERSFVVVEKTAKTDDKYPRKAGKPSKNPL